MESHKTVLGTDTVAITDMQKRSSNGGWDGRHKCGLLFGGQALFGHPFLFYSSTTYGAMMIISSPHLLQEDKG